jgi:YD repeat-containing protein
MMPFPEELLRLITLSMATSLDILINRETIFGNPRDDKAGVTEYSYDNNGNLKDINDPNPNTTTQFAYDALGRKIRKIDSVAGKTTLYYGNAFQAGGLEKNRVPPAGV